jgi:crossover junction endodeoxyribonuclease RusA
VLDLPFPPTVNSIWRTIMVKGKPRHLLSKKYREWKDACDAKFWVAGWAQGWAKEGIQTPIRTPVDVAIVLNRSKRRGDTDNRIKPCLDWLQRSGVIANDSLVENVSAGWGDVPDGVRITITPASVAASKTIHEEEK